MFSSDSKNTMIFYHFNLNNHRIRCLDKIDLLFLYGNLLRIILLHSLPTIFLSAPVPRESFRLGCTFLSLLTSQANSEWHSLAPIYTLQVGSSHLNSPNLKTINLGF